MLQALSLKPSKQEIYWPKINDKFRHKQLSTKDLGALIKVTANSKLAKYYTPELN